MANAAAQTAAFDAWNTATSRWFDLWTNMIRTTDPNPLSGDQAKIDQFMGQIAQAKADAAAKEAAYFMSAGGTRAPAVVVRFIKGVHDAAANLESTFQAAPSPTNAAFEQRLSAGFNALSKAFSDLLAVAPGGVAPAGQPVLGIPQPAPGLPVILQAQLDAVRRQPGSFTPAQLSTLAGQLQAAGFPIQAREVRLAAGQAEDVATLPANVQAAYQTALASPDPSTAIALAGQLDAFGFPSQAAKVRSAAGDALSTTSSQLLAGAQADPLHADPSQLDAVSAQLLALGFGDRAAAFQSAAASVRAARGASATVQAPTPTPAAAAAAPTLGQKLLTIALATSPAWLAMIFFQPRRG